MKLIKKYNDDFSVKISTVVSINSKAPQAQDDESKTQVRITDDSYNHYN
jgi:hypothetical protein